MIRESEDHQKVFDEIEKLATNLKSDNFVALTSGYGLGEVRFTNDQGHSAAPASKMSTVTSKRLATQPSDELAPMRPRHKSAQKVRRKFTASASRFATGAVLFIFGISAALLLAAKFHAIAPHHLARQIETRLDMQVGFMCWLAACLLLHRMIFRLVRSPNLG